MNAASWYAFFPFILLAAAPVVVMLAIAVKRDQRTCLALSVGMLTLALYCAGRLGGMDPQQYTPLMVVDNFSLFYTGLAILAGLCVIMLGAPYISRREGQPEEYYVLILTAVAGASVMSGATHFASFYLGLEILTVSQYGLIGYIRKDKRGTEAAVKYLILAAASAAFLLMGMALLYAELGTMQFSEMAVLIPDHLGNRVLLLGLAMFAVGLGFKLSLAPFHLWTPDVYEGAPAPVTAFIATAGKTAMLAVLVRLAVVEEVFVAESLMNFLAIAAAASMIIGNLLAIVQTNLKRMLAYSSVAHMGYIATAFIALGPAASEAIAFYAVTYTAAGLAAWGVLIVLSARAEATQDVEQLEDYRGLFRVQPTLGAVLALSMLSLAGIPFTGGFIGKLLILAAAAGSHNSRALLMFVLAITSVIGAYYYLRVVVLILSPAAGRTERVRISQLAAAALITLSGLSILPGIAPNFFLSLIQRLYGNG